MKLKLILRNGSRFRVGWRRRRRGRRPVLGLHGAVDVLVGELDVAPDAVQPRHHVRHVRGRHRAGHGRHRDRRRGGLILGRVPPAVFVRGGYDEEESAAVRERNVLIIIAVSLLRPLISSMREMGIQDESLARKALTVMGGDLQAAIDLIFSGWLGQDD